MKASPPPFYSQLNSTDRREISDLCTRYEESLLTGTSTSLEQSVLAAEPRLQLALLEQLLPIEVDTLQRNRGATPTLHELSVLYPNLEELLPFAYRQLPLNIQLPDVLGVYRLVRMVGSGTQATIAIGRHRRLMQSVAIKFSRDEESARRLMQEAAFLSRLSGLNVPTVLDDGRTPDGVAFIIMEYLEGRNLYDLVNDQGVITDPERVAAYALQIAETVDQMHQRGIVHRDLSPRNIHVGDDGRLRIVDFGLAVEVSSGMSTRADVQEFHGTPAFMSPEQRNFVGKIDGRLSDIYTLGRLLLFMTNGVHAVLETAPDGQSLHDPGTHRIRNRRLARIYATATDPDPARRYQSAGKLADDLRAYLRSRHRIRMASKSLIVTVLLCFGVVIFNWGTSRKPPVSASTDPPPQVAVAVSSHTPAGPSWIESLAAEQGLDLKSISAGDFSLRFVAGDPFHVSRSAIGPMEAPRYGGKLFVSFPPRLQDFVGAMRVRFGKRPWQHLLKGIAENEWYLLVERQDAEKNLPVQLMLYAAATLTSGQQTIGPFQYDLGMEKKLASADRAELDHIRNMEWFDTRGGAWTISETMLGSEVVSRVPLIHIGISPQSLTQQVALRLPPASQTTAERILPIGELFNQPAPEPTNQRLRREMREQMSVLGHPVRIYAQLESSSGGRSDIRAFSLENDLLNEALSVHWIDGSGEWRFRKIPNPFCETLEFGRSADQLTESLKLTPDPGETTPWVPAEKRVDLGTVNTYKLDPVIWEKIEPRIQRDFEAGVERLKNPEILYTRIRLKGGVQTEIRSYRKWSADEIPYGRRPD
ncbi:serine/threonine protein kinase [Planctomicrobium sp. SH668]|uniref:serine/threonine protein kinase n=1 Tax=Planctomicrobium sp. SH668 TaxID=3448126 RepID=UPI003F5B34D5